MFQNTQSVILRVKEDTNVMSKKLLIDLVERWFDETSYNELEVIFSGSEPMQVDINTFSSYLKIIYATAREFNIASVSCRVQTKAMVMNKKWLALFEKYKVKVSVEYNGFKVENGTIGNLLYFNGFDMLSHIQMTLSKQNNLTLLDDIEILINLDLHNFKINTAYGTDQLSDDELYSFSVKLIQLMIKYPDLLEINMFNKLLSFFNKNNDSIDVEREKVYNKNFCNTGKKVIEVDPNGDLFYYDSDKLVGKNIYTQDVLELNNSLEQFKYNEPKINLVIDNKCGHCLARYFCYSDRTQEYSNTTYCLYNKELAKYFSKNKNKLFEIINSLNNGTGE